MTVTTHILNGDFSALVGEVASIRATLKTNSADAGWVNNDDNVIRLGGAVLPLDRAGKFSIALPTSTGTGLRYEVIAEFIDPAERGGRKTWHSGEFSLTANGDLADLANESTLRIAKTLGEQLADRIDGYVDHGDASGELILDPTLGTHVLDATGDLDVSIGDAVDGRMVTVRIESGLSNVTWLDATFDAGEPDAEPATVTFLRTRGEWIAPGGSGGGTSSGNVAATAPTFNDPLGSTSDSVTIPSKNGVIYRIAGTAIPAGTHTLSSLGITAGAVVTVTAVAATGFTLTGTTEWSHDFDTAAGWNVVATDDFTAADGTVVDGRTTGTGGKTWSLFSGPAVTIVGNKVPWSATGYTAQELRMLLGGDNAAGVAVEWGYTGGFKVGAAINSPPHYAGVSLEDGNLYAAGGYPPTGLSGTLTGLPSSGRARIEIMGTSLRFLIDGVEKATATTLPLKGNFVAIALINGSSMDNVRVETYS